MPDCIVPGCPREARNKLGIRLRRPDTTAIWAPNTDAFVCDSHASTGAHVTVYYEPTETHSVEVVVHGATHGTRRTTGIVHEAVELDEALQPSRIVEN